MRKTEVLEMHFFYIKKEISIKDTAEHFGTSKATLQRLFKKYNLKSRDKKQNLIQAAKKRGNNISLFFIFLLEQKVFLLAAQLHFNFF